MSSAAGWYPNGDRWETYWDGTQWLDMHRPVAAPMLPEATDGRGVLAAASAPNASVETFISPTLPVAPVSVLPHATRDVVVDTCPEGVSIHPLSWLAKGTLGEQRRIILWDDISSIEAVAGGFKIREGRKALRVNLAPVTPAQVGAIISEIACRCLEATGRTLSTTKLSRSEKRTAIEGTFGRGLDHKLVEIASLLEHGTHRDEVVATHALLLWANALKVKGGSELVAVRLNELRTRMGWHVPAPVGIVAGQFLHPNIEVFDDRVIMGQEAHPIDEFTHAQVYLDGQMQVTTRPSMTAAAFGSILPGTALIPAMAFGKKERTDTRVAEFHIGSREWLFKARISPSSLSEPRGIAQRVNAIADGLEKAAGTLATATPAAGVSAPSPTEPPPAAAREADGDLTSQVERIVELERCGAITVEQASAMKARIIGI